MRSWRTWNLTSVSALEEWSGDSAVVRYAWPGCSGAATEDGVNDFAGRDETSSSELGVELGIKSEFAQTSLHLRRKRAARLVWCTCLVLARRDAMSDFA